jgi:acyl carrier protein
MLAVRSLKRGVHQVRFFASAAVEAPPAAYLSETEVANRVLAVLRASRSCPSSATLNHSFSSELGFDSLHRKDLNSRIMDEFCLQISDKDLDGFVSGAAIAQYIAKQPKAR